MRRGAEEEDFDPLDGDAEGHDQEAGDDADEDGEEQEEPLFASGCELLQIDGAKAEAVERACAEGCLG